MGEGTKHKGISVIAVLGALVMISCGGATLKYPIEIRTPVSYLMKKDQVSEKAQPGGGTRCVREVTVEVTYMPAGDSRKVDFEGGYFASNQFTVVLHESGTLKQVTLNSDPQVDETITAVGTSVEKIAAALVTLAPLAVLAAVPCVPSVSVKFAPLRCFLDPQPTGIQGCPPDPSAW